MPATETSLVECAACGSEVPPADTVVRNIVRGSLGNARCHDDVDICDSCDESMSRCDCERRFPASCGETVDGSPSCPVCAGEAYTCECCGSLHSEDCGDSRLTLCEGCRRERYVECNDCDRLVDTDDCSRNSGGNRICDSCDENYFTCDRCDNRYHNDDYGGDDMCQGCYDEREGEGEPAYEADCGEEILGQACIESAMSTRCFGVELEFSECDYHDARLLCENSGWGACEDGTTGVQQEFTSPIMSGDLGIESAREFCEQAKSLGLQVSHACGFHLHIDMRREKELQIARIATAYQVFLPVWQSFVPESRRKNIYCSEDAANGTAERIAEGKDKPHKDAGKTARYCAVNWQAYKRHKTVEIRLHSGTCDAGKVCNWIRAHVAFIEYFRKMPLISILEHEGKPLTDRWHVLRRAWNSETLDNFYAARAEKFGTCLPLE